MGEHYQLDLHTCPRILKPLSSSKIQEGIGIMSDLFELAWFGKTSELLEQIGHFS